MGRKSDEQDGIWLSPNADRRRLRDAENARKNRQEITKALSHGQISRRDLVKWGLFTTAGTIAGIGGLSPYVRAQTTSFSSFSGGCRCGVPPRLPPNPPFCFSPFTPPHPRLYFLPLDAPSPPSPPPHHHTPTPHHPPLPPP